MGTLATPIAGSLITSSFIGGSATNSALATGTVAVNMVAGGGAYLAGGYTENAVNQGLGNPASFTPTVFGFVANAGGNAAASYVAGKAFSTPTNSQRTLAQASRFLPRTTKTILNALSGKGSRFARNLYWTGGATSAFIGTASGIASSLLHPTTPSSPPKGGSRTRIE